MKTLAIPAFALLALVANVSASAHWNGTPTAGGPDKAWWDSLASGKGLCCSISDGRTVDDPDYGTENTVIDGAKKIVYWVRVDGKKLIVPPDALVTVPNRFGRAIVWPVTDGTGNEWIRCFMPGAQG